MIDALADSSIRFVTTRDERGAAFMADTYGALTGKPGVCLATLGPGAINLMLGIANAQLDSHPLVAITAQAGLGRIYKESHQFVDLVSLYRPITKWGDMVTLPEAAPEMVRKAFKLATTERPGATFIVLPEDVAELPGEGTPLPVNVPRDPAPSEDQVHRAAHVLESATHPVVLAGPGIARDGAVDAADPVLRAPERPGRDDVPGQGRVPRRSPERARDDRVHGPGLRELRVRPRRRRGGRRLRPGGVLAGALEPEPGQADRARPPHGGRGRRALLARGGAPGFDRGRRSTRSPGRRTCTRSPVRCLRSEAWCTRSWSAERRTTRSR